MKLAALSGGIGSGKSTVAARLTDHGAIVVDVDQLSRELQQPGRAVFEAMVRRWGRAVIREDGGLDRPAVADIVFADHHELAALHAMTNQPIEDEIYARVVVHQGTDRVVLLEAALLTGDRLLYGTNGLILVDAPEDVAIARLVYGRGMSEEDARARLAAQPPRAERLRHGGFVIDNAGRADLLVPQVERAWRWLRGLPDAEIERGLGR